MKLVISFIFLSVCLSDLSYAADECRQQGYECCKQEGYELDTAKDFLSILKDHATLDKGVSEFEYQQAYKLYERIEKNYKQCIETNK